MKELRNEGMKELRNEMEVPALNFQLPNCRIVSLSHHPIITLTH